LPKSPPGTAVGYALRNWTALTRDNEDGRLKIDNDGAEQALRPIVLGRKNLGLGLVLELAQYFDQLLRMNFIGPAVLPGTRYCPGTPR
jgi:hypothetical protein